MESKYEVVEEPDLDEAEEEERTQEYSKHLVEARFVALLLLVVLFNKVSHVLGEANIGALSGD